MGFVLSRKAVKSLQLDDDLFKANQISDIFFREAMAFVRNHQMLLAGTRNAPELQLNLHCRLVHGFKESRAKLSMGFYGCADDGVDLVFQNQISYCVPLFVFLRVLRG